MATKRSVSVSADWCHICGLPITDNIVSPDHPLFGTVDHVIPRSRGGSNALEHNRAAHRSCNKAKGSRPLDFVDRYGQQGVIKSLFARIGVMVTRTMLMKARGRLGIRTDAQPKTPLPESLQRWDNEGGFPGRGRTHYENMAFLEQ